MWYIIDVIPNAKLKYGLKKDVTRDVFINAVKENFVEKVLHEITVKKGDVLFIPSGTIHAIGEGIIID